MTTDYTDNDVTRLANLMAPLTEPRRVIARRLLDQGVTLPPPPPDPAVVVAEALWQASGAEVWSPASYTDQGRFLAAVRDLFTPEALAQAAAALDALDQEADA